MSAASQRARPPEWQAGSAAPMQGEGQTQEQTQGPHQTPAHTSHRMPHQPVHTRRRVPPRVLWLTLGAVVLYGAIAALANRGHGAGPMLRAALVQGLSCGVTTFGLSTFVDRGLEGLLRWHCPRPSAAAAVALAAAVLGIGLHVGVNLWAGTPELAATVAVPAAALAVYCPLYAAAALRRTR